MEANIWRGHFEGGHFGGVGTFKGHLVNEVVNFDCFGGDFKGHHGVPVVDLQVGIGLLVLLLL